MQTVTISDWTAGATIYYTTDGTTPTTSSTLYTGQVTVSATETLEAIATAAGFANSPMSFGGLYHQPAGSHADLQPRGRHVSLGADGNHQRRDSERNDLLHHRRNHAHAPVPLSIARRSLWRPGRR